MNAVFLSASRPVPIPKSHDMTVKGAIGRLNDLLSGRISLPKLEKIALFGRVDQLLASYKPVSSSSSELAALERCALAARKRFPLFLEDNEKRVKQLEQTVTTQNRAMLKKWTEACHFPQQVFFSHPDFVEFVFSSFIHKSLHYFRQTLQLISGEPHLLVEGKYLSWKEMRSRFVVEEGKIYSVENGEKKRWVYLENGLVPHDTYSWSMPRPIKTLKEKQAGWSFQLVTSHASEKNQDFTDRILEGARHSWFRLITSEGEVYSFGLGFNPQHFDGMQPLSSMKALILCPDTYETYAERRLETTIPITEEQAKKVFEKVISCQKSGDRVFNFIDRNCAGFAREVMEEAGIASVPNDMHFTSALAKLLFPKIIRRGLKRGWKAMMAPLPQGIGSGLTVMKNAFFSLLFLPLASVLGGWRYTEPRLKVTVTAAVKPLASTSKIQVWAEEFFARKDIAPPAKRSRSLYGSIWDALSPNQLTFATTRKLAKWQKAQGSMTVQY